MSEKSASQKGKEFVNALKKQNPLIFWSVCISIILFFIPVINILLPVYWGIFLGYKFFPILKRKFTNIFISAIATIVLFFTVLVSFIIPVSAYNLALFPNETKSQNISKIEENHKKDTTEIAKSLEEETNKRVEVQKFADQESQKRIEEENTRKELENKIETATTINPDYDVESDLEKQDLQSAKQANLAIANLGNTTQNQKLFEVLTVVDGDTIKISELGTLRLIGIDTPETKDPRKPVQCFGLEASQRAKQLLDDKKVYLEFDPANRIDKYGRTLTYVYREDGYFYNAQMIKDGFANSYTKFPHPKLDEFNKLAREARENQRGLYSKETCNGNTSQAAKTSTPHKIQAQPKISTESKLEEKNNSVPEVRTNSEIQSNSSETTQNSPITIVPTEPPVIERTQNNDLSTEVKTESTPTQIQPTSPPQTKTSTEISTQTSNSSTPQNSGYVPGTCIVLKSLGLSNFRPGDPNYTSQRDRDNDGIACE